MTKASDSNEWWTPEGLYNSLCKKYGVNPELDAAATFENTKCRFFLHDAFEQDWTLGDNNPCIVDIWCNPPLGKGLCKKFVLKALEQWTKYNMNILMIVPAGVISRQYFQYAWDRFLAGRIQINPIIPRPRFLLNGKPTKWQARNDYISILFRKFI